MRLREFIAKNRREIDQVIKAAGGAGAGRITDAERESWVLNHEGLYTWARGAGCKV